MIRFPALSREKTLPGGIAVVALYSVTMAGPEYFLPGRSSWREKICVGSFLPANRTWALDGEGLPRYARPGRPGAAVPTWAVVTCGFEDFMDARRRRVTSSTSL